MLLTSMHMAIGDNNFLKIHNKGGLMKVLLTYPEFPDTFWSFKRALKFIHKKATSLRSV
jgi:hypothetical protein